VIVADSSAIIEILLKTPAGSVVATHLLAHRSVLHIPHLADVEIANVLRRYVRTGELSAERAEMALEDYSLLPLVRHVHHSLLPRIWELRQNASAHDATYLALTEVLDATLITRDQKLASIPGLRASVLVC